MTRLFWFAIVCLFAWVVVAVPARMSGGDVQAVYAGIALLICAIPCAATLLWVLVVAKHHPQTQLVAILGGTGLRLMAVSVTAWLLFARVAFLRQEGGFAIWVLAAYLFTLVLEMILALKGRNVSEASQQLVR